MHNDGQYHFISPELNKPIFCIRYLIKPLALLVVILCGISSNLYAQTDYSSSLSGGDNPLSGVPQTSDGVITGDFDNDGDINVLAFDDSNYDSYKFYANDGSGSFSVVTGSANPFDGLAYTDIFFAGDNTYVADFDNDGDQDIWDYRGQTSGDSQNIYLENTGSGYTSSKSGGSNPLSGIPDFEVIVGDFDNDGDIDVLAFDDDNYDSYKFYANDGSGTFSVATGSANPFDGLPYTDIFFVSDNTYVADFDNDGDQDIWDYRGQTSGDSQNIYLENTGSGYTSSKSGGSNPLSGIPDPAAGVIVGDFDNDGDVDVLAYDDDTYSSFSFYANNGSGSFSKVTGSSNPFNGIASENIFYAASNTLVADFDNEGDQDIWDYGGDTNNNGPNIYLKKQGSPSSNDTPTFNEGSSTSLTVNEDASATSINSLLDVTDTDSGDNLTWSISSAPSNGSLGGFLTTESSTGGSVTPSGLTYTPNPDYNGSDSFDIQISDGNDTAIITVNVTINAVNDPPEFTSPSGFNIYENYSGIIADVDATDGEGGSSDANVNYTLAGADAAAFSINPNTGELSLDVARDFENPTDNDGNNDYELEVTASDGTNITNQNITITITDVNEAPVITNLNGDNNSVQPGGAAAKIDAAGDATVTNIDSPDYNGGFIRISDNNANNTAHGNFSVDGTNVTSGGDGTIAAGETIAIGGTAVGTIHATHDGQGGNNLEIYFTSTDATNARIQTLVRNLRWGAATGSGAQTFTLTLNDGDGTANGGDHDDNSNFSMTLGNPPVISNLDGDTVDFLEEGPPVTLDVLASATLTDADNPASLNGGNVTATVSSGAVASEDLLKLNTDGAVSLSGTTSGSTVSVSGTPLGTLANDITTGNSLRVNFNANATLARVELLLQALQYSSSASPLTENSREVQVIVTDNQGLPSDPSTITVNTVVDESPTVPNTIADLSVDEDAASDTYDLTNVFSDPEDNDGDLTFSVQNNDNSSLVDASVDNSTDQLTLDYQPYQTGTANITIRAEDSRGQTVDDSFTITVNRIAQTIYVNADASSGGDGSSWGSAFQYLQDALNAAGGEDQIWIAEGTYYPDEGANVTQGDETAYFTITGDQDGLEIYGGFDGTETQLADRDIAGHRTILSGDIDQDDDPLAPNTDSDNDPDTFSGTDHITGNNSNHVLFIDGKNNGAITNTTLLNGLTITGGQAKGANPEKHGGGMHCEGRGSGSECSPTLNRLIFAGNTTLESYSFGGAIYYSGVNNGTISNTGFYSNNTSGESGRGGAIRNSGSGSSSNATIINTIFINNHASGQNGVGGAISSENVAATPTITNGIFYGNRAGDKGNQFHNITSTPTISHSLIEGSGGSSNWNSDLGTDGGGNIDVNPQFVDATNPAGVDGTWFTDDDGLVLQPTSPAVDAGDNNTIPSGITTDISGKQRIQGGTVDMGAYESLSNNPPTVANPIADITVDEDAASDTYDLTDVFSDNEEDDADLTFSIQKNNNTNLVDASIDNTTDMLTLNYQSNQSGTTNITVRAKDSSDETVDDSFEVTVNLVNDAPWISSIKNQSLTAGQTAGPISFTIEDIDDDLADLSLSAISDNQAVLPDQNILLSGSGSDRSVTLKTEENTSGNAMVEIIVDDGALSDTTSFELSITTNAPKQVTLEAPENKSTDQSLQPKFTWDIAAEAETYEFQLADEASFTDENIIAEQSDISETEIELSKKLNRETAYYWRVRGTNTGGKGGWSSKYQFTTIPALPARVTLKAPANKKSGVNTQPIFSWETVNNADTYEWQLSKDENFDSLINEATLSENDLQPNDELAHNTSYYWRVRALNSGGKGDWSSKQRFTTEASPPALSFPSDNETGISIAPRLAWSSDYENSRFRVKLSKDQQLQNMILDTLVTSETVKISGLQPNTDYFWQVRVETEENNSAPSPISNFTTRMPTESEMVDTKITFGQSGNSDLQSYDYRLMSLPGNESHPIDEFFNGEYGTDWKAFEDNGDEENFLQEYSDDHPLSFTSGKGYWVLSKKAVRVEDEISAVDISEDDTYILELEPGWNIIGNPFNRPASWQDIQAFNNRSLILYEYEGSFSKSKQMDPFKGYYVYNDSTAVLNLEIPYTSLQKMRSKDRNTSKEKGTNRKIRLKINQLKDDITSQVEINYPSQTGSSIKQKQDHYLPPLRLSKFGAGIINEEHEHRQKMMHTINSHFDEKRNKYTIELKTESRSEVVWKPEIEGMNSQTAVLIVEPQNGRTKILGDGESYPFMAKIGRQRFTVYTGSLSDLKEIEKSLVPQQITLNPNYPNPFSSTTTIQIGIDQHSEVTLEVFNILGQKVRTLVNESMKAGWHKVVFDGSRLASGTYFYRLTVGEQIQTKKMVLIK
ncbi:hypothetical protein CK503_14175 [Aliifodinibius salipaludis]|uniref:Cadherin domain-containing protein n=1 Tax=Fodinibius salipaludis TaxID=2032627 RepID=A0A2A2G880_9BACT|nr:T9SS type A sorting domain-containing protein [Aliifodinibius salipaludis]PAU93062.1 hypothetical protein CK503_14175 [Aliifodinibius salipaludis]